MTDERGARLRATAELIPSGSRVADVGTDHGRLPRFVLSSGRASYCVATERHETRLARVRRPPPEGTSASRLELRWGDGLDPLRPDDRLDVIVLAGMGARTIVRILDNPRRARLGARRLVLQPQSEIALLRRWLASRKLVIVAETLVRDRGHFYVALAAENGSGSPCAGHPRLSEDELFEVGPCLVASRDPLVRRYWRLRRRREERILERARGAGCRAARRRHDLACRVLALLGSPDAGQSDPSRKSLDGR